VTEPAAADRPVGARIEYPSPARRNQARKRALFNTIQQDAAAGLSKRALERKHHVGRRTIVKALTAKTPPERKKPTRRVSVLHEFQHHVDAMIEKNPTIAVKDVWEHLVDDHDATVSYGATRAYVTRYKAEQAGRSNSIRGARGSASRRHRSATCPMINETSPHPAVSHI